MQKLERNRQRDTENVAALRGLGWNAMTVWECELKDLDSVLARIALFLITAPDNANHALGTATELAGGCRLLD